MTARDKLYAYAGTPCVLPESMLDKALDAYRTEVLAKAVGRLRAIPVTCTALTGPVWYGDGWNSAITVLEEIAEYQTPDDEAFPGELQRLRALALGLRVAAIRKNDLAEVQRLLAIYEETRTAATAAGTTATPEFFEPGRTYTSGTWEFRCVALSPSPTTGELRALGWKLAPVYDVHRWYPIALDPDDWTHGGWTEVTEAGQAPVAQHYDKVPDPADGCHWCACGNRWPCKHATAVTS